MRFYPEEQVKASFEAKYIPEPNSGCWLWLATLNNMGYPQLAVAQKKNGTSTKLAHRLSYEWFKGPIPKGKVLDHLCRLPCCVNPDHLEPVTQRINVLRGSSLFALNAAKTHCNRGHELTAENTYSPPPRTGGRRPYRQCKICRSANRRLFWETNKR